MKVSGANSGRGHRSHSMPMAEINIIPLVDVVLVLLIIFMATTAFVKESGLNMKLPAAKTTEVKQDDKKDITVDLTRDNKIYLDTKPTDLKTIEATMLARARKAPDTSVIVKADKHIAYERVVQVIDLAKQAGLPKVMLGTYLPDTKAAGG